METCIILPMKTKKLVTAESLQKLLDSDNQTLVTQAVGRALVVLMHRQTATEKQSNTTGVDNGVGFTGSDAFSGTVSAKSFLKHKTLQDWQVAKWTKKNAKGVARLTKYWRQLNEAAVAKAEGRPDPGSL